jgi:hypothetical protein
MSGNAGSPVAPGGMIGRRRQRRNEVEVRQEEARHGALEHDDLDLGIGLDLRDDAVELRNGLGAEDD